MFERNKATARRMLEEAFNEGRLDVIDELVAPDWVDHDPQSPASGMRGPEAARATVQTYRRAFPDLHLDVEAQYEDGDCVVTRWHSTGTHDGELMGMPATHRHAESTGITIDRFDGGKAIESWTNWDALGLLQQLGAVPSMRATA